MLKNTMTETAIDLRELMELAGLTFKALGDRIGVNQAQVFRALSGEIKLRPESMKAMEMAIVEAARDRAAKLAAVLGVITPSASMWQEVTRGLKSDTGFQPHRKYKENINGTDSQKTKTFCTCVEQRCAAADKA
jgi:transcriptional regulator with XRE-family HTH domain